MGIWNSSPHPISDLRDWQKANRLEVRPDFQRREVWSPAAKIMLIDTILRSVPMPKMFLWNEVIKDSTHRRVIDGQQRILAILGYLDDQFALDAPYVGPYQGQKFSELPASERTRILQYRIDYNEAIGFEEAEVREVYSRVNKYSLPLNKQELRKADFPGQFLDLASELSLNEYLDEAKVFSVAQRRRMGDVEFTSELLAGMLEGPQDKKDDLDYFYSRYAEWDATEVAKARKEFQAVVFDLELIFDEKIFPLRTTRFKQKADFYTLFLSILECHRAGYGLGTKPLDALRGDLRILDEQIAPESEVDILREYAIKCVSQANSVSSRAWRRNFLMEVIGGTYRPTYPSPAITERLKTIVLQSNAAGQNHLFDLCGGCGKQFNDQHGAEREMFWPKDSATFQMSNALWCAAECRGDL
jgi:hypothetical protein